MKTTIKCEYCHQDVAPTAPTCPHCGAQLIKPTRSIFGKATNIVWWIFHVFMALWMVFMFKQHGEVPRETWVLSIGLLGSFWFTTTIPLAIVRYITRPQVRI